MREVDAIVLHSNNSDTLPMVYTSRERSWMRYGTSYSLQAYMNGTVELLEVMT